MVEWASSDGAGFAPGAAFDGLSLIEDHVLPVEPAEVLLVLNNLPSQQQQKNTYRHNSNKMRRTTQITTMNGVNLAMTRTTAMSRLTHDSDVSGKMQECLQAGSL